MPIPTKSRSMHAINRLQHKKDLPEMNKIIAIVGLLLLFAAMLFYGVPVVQKLGFPASTTTTISYYIEGT